MLLDAFQLLSIDGFPIRSYQYSGMGSIFFYDFVFFHKFLGIDRMVSAEFDTSIQKRVSFNSPFRHIEVRNEPIGNVISTLSPDLQHILWLDYDQHPVAWQMRDILDSCHALTRGSILLVTFDAEPPGGRGSEPSESLEHYLGEFEEYLDAQPIAADFAPANLPRTIARIVLRVISRGLVSRRDIEFVPMFNFVYADGHKMVTLGGMFGTRDERRRLERGLISQASYFRGNWDGPAVDIAIPKITKKERYYLDAGMPREGTWMPRDFEIHQEDLDAYSKVYRFLPAYGELLV